MEVQQRHNEFQQLLHAGCELAAGFGTVEHVLQLLGTFEEHGRGAAVRPGWDIRDGRPEHQRAQRAGEGRRRLR